MFILTYNTYEMKEKSSSAPWVNCACGVITIYSLSVLNVVCLLVIFVSWMLIKRSKSDIFWEQKEQTRRNADRTNKTEKNANIFLTDSICFYLFCLKDFWSRPLQMQHFFFSVAFFRVWKRRLLMCLLSFIELSCIRTLNGHHTRHHSMFYDIFVVKEKKIYAKEFTRWISDFWCEVQRICLNENTVNWLSFGIVLFSAIFICAIYFFIRILLCFAVY